MKDAHELAYMMWRFFPAGHVMPFRQSTDAADLPDFVQLVQKLGIVSLAQQMVAKLRVRL